MKSTLDTGIKNSRNVLRYTFGENTLSGLGDILLARRENKDDYVIYFIDSFFKNNDDVLNLLPIDTRDQIVFVDTKDEPTTEYINTILDGIISTDGYSRPCALVGIGGGITLDTAKAISNLLTNGGAAEDYQGWDLVKKPGIFKVGIPTLSGTGASARANARRS